ncbi:hypothetical protein U1Q18_015395 [Sarracenia purpurea var. burkii]
MNQGRRKGKMRGFDKTHYVEEGFQSPHPTTAVIDVGNHHDTIYSSWYAPVWRTPPFHRDNDEDPIAAQNQSFALLRQVPIHFSLFNRTQEVWILPLIFTMRQVDRRGATKTKQEQRKPILQIKLRSVFSPHGVELH